MRKLHWEDFPAHFHWFCCGLSALSLFYSSIWSCRTSQWIKKGNRKVLMRPGFSNYPCTKEYLCISLTPSVYLQTPALLLCKAGAALRGYYCKSRLCSPSFPPQHNFSKDFKPSVCRDKRKFVQLPEKPGDLMLAGTFGCVFFCWSVCSQKNPLKQQRSGKTLSPTHPLNYPTPSPHSPWPILFNQRLPSPAGTTKHWPVTPGVNFRVCRGKIITSLCPQMSVWH